MSGPLFRFENVSKYYEKRAGIFSQGLKFAALEEINLTLQKGKVYGLVGESGSGKSTLAGLLCGFSRPSRGTIFFEERPLSEHLGRGRASYAGKVQMIFQNPYLSLDPRWRLEKIIGEGISRLSAAEKQSRIAEAMRQVKLPEDYLKRRPGSLSGGERQRAAIARALAVKPSYLILDEPTSQLDVSVQAAVLRLLKGLRSQIPSGMLFISHDLATVSELADEIIVLENGRVAEKGPAPEVLRSPRAECTKRLLEAVPFWKKRSVS